LRLSYLPLLTLITLPHIAKAAEAGVTSGELLQQTPALTRSLSPASTDDARGLAAPSSSAATTPVDGELVFVAADFRFDESLSDDERARTEPVLAPLRGQPTTLRQLQALRAQLTEALYHDGDTLVSVLLPAQTVEDGVVRFQIVRGRIERVQVKNGSQVDTARLEAMLSGSDGATPDLRAIESRARIIGEVPGVGAVTPVLKRGSVPGGTEVLVDVQPGRSGYFAVTADNAGAPEAGAYRVGVLGGVNNLVGRGDRLDAIVYTTTPYPLQTNAGRGGRTLLGRISWDALTGIGASRAGMAASRVDYRLGGDFKGLGNGTAQVVSLYASTPVLRSRAATLDVSAEADYKALDDERFGDLLESRRHSVVAMARIDGSQAHDLLGHAGTAQYGLALSYGTTQQTAIDRTVSSDGVSKLGSRPFVKIEPSVGASEKMLPGMAISARLRGQWANGSLDGSERMSLGGPSAVRAYGLSTASVDEGAVASLEITQSVASAPNIAVTGFYDAAFGRIRAIGTVPGASTTLQGAGIALKAGWKQAQMELSYARAIGRPDGVMRNQQVWVTLSKVF
jgi:hemolysin activation/secretion protein